MYISVSRTSERPRHQTVRVPSRAPDHILCVVCDATFLSRPDLQPVPEKQQQARILSMGTKRVLDAAELSDDDNTRQDDLIDMFNPPVRQLRSMLLISMQGEERPGIALPIAPTPGPCLIT